MRRNIFLVVVLIFIMLFSLTACGSKNESSAETAEASTAAQQDVIEKLAEEAAEVPAPNAEVAASGDSAAAGNETQISSAEKLLGEWADINNESRFVKISNIGDQYEYENADGKYQGIYKDGVLTIKVSDVQGDTAMVFIDAKTGNMVTNYQGDIYEYTRKAQ